MDLRIYLEYIRGETKCIEISERNWLTSLLIFNKNFFVHVNNGKYSTLQQAKWNVKKYSLINLGMTPYSPYLLLNETIQMWKWIKVCISVLIPRTVYLFRLYKNGGDRNEKKMYKNNADTKWNKKIYRDSRWIPEWQFTRRKYRDHPTLPGFIESILSKVEYFFSLALDTHLYTYFSTPLPFEFVEILLNRRGKDIANCSKQIESNRCSRNREKKDESKQRKADWKGSYAKKFSVKTSPVTN